MEITLTKVLNNAQKLAIIELWNKEYPSVFFHAGIGDFDSYLSALEDRNHILITGADGGVKGWLMYFVRDDEQCFAMLLDASLQGKGWGSKLLNRAKEHNSELVGWVIETDGEPKLNGENYKSPIGFYRKNGFAIRTDLRLTKKNINGIKVIWRKAGI